MLRRYAFFLLIVLISCDDDDDGPQPVEKSYAFLQIVKGVMQSGGAGEPLKDSIVLRVLTANTALRTERFYVEYAMTKGNGNLTSTNPFFAGRLSPTPSGQFRTSWQLGCDRVDQAVTFYLYYADSCTQLTPKPCVPIDSVTITATATASTHSGWNRLCGADYTDRYNTKMRVFNNEVYVSVSGTLYKVQTGALGRSLEKVPGVPVTHFFDFNFTSDGRIYLLTDNNGVYTSDDLRQWTNVSNGIIDQRYPLSLLVEDSVVYASFKFDGLYRLRPSKEIFWKKLLIDGIYYDEYAFPVRHPNGDLYVVDKWDSYWVSKNSGDTWNYVPIDYQYVNYETEDFQIDASGNLYIGAGDATLSILDPTSYTGTKHRYYEWNSSSQFVDNILFRNTSDVYYLVNYTPNPGIYSSVNGWQKVDTGFDKVIHKFVFDPAGTFLLMSNDGIYYRKD